MSQNESHAAADDVTAARQARLDELRQGVAEKLSRGISVNIGMLARDHPDLMPELQEELRLLEMTHRQLLAAQRVGPVHSQGMEEGEVVVPGYRIDEALGTGGQGVVFRAIQLSTRREVAIKVLLGGPLLSRRRQVRLQREVSILASLRHPHIIGVFDHGRTVDGSVFMAMDYVPGQDLDAWVEGLRHHEPDRVKFIHRVLALFVKIADAVAEAHAQNIVHRDLKPSNIRVNDRNEPYLLDFGLARVVSDEDAGAGTTRSVTMEGGVVGSLPWLSPEQAAGTNRDVGAPSDVYSLGLMLYEALADKPPYPQEGSLAESLLAIQNAIPEPPGRFSPELSPDVDRVILKALAKDPAHRHANAAELLDDLRQCLASPTRTPHDDAPAAPPRPPAAPRDADNRPPRGLKEPAEPTVPKRRRRSVMAAVAMTAAAALLFPLMRTDCAHHPDADPGDQSQRPPPAVDTRPAAANPSDIPPQARLLKLVPVEDTFVRDGSHATTPQGSEEVRPNSSHVRLEVKTVIERGYTRDVYLRFPLEMIPRGKTLHRARLFLYGTANATSGQDDIFRSIKVSVLPLKDPKAQWSEKTLTWANRPFLLGWEKAETALTTTVIPVGKERWHEFEVTPFIRSEVDANRSSTTLGLHAPEPGDVIALFASSESATPPTLHVHHEP